MTHVVSPFRPRNHLSDTRQPEPKRTRRGLQLQPPQHSPKQVDNPLATAPVVSLAKTDEPADRSDRSVLLQKTSFQGLRLADDTQVTSLTSEKSYSIHGFGVTSAARMNAGRFVVIPTAPSSIKYRASSGLSTVHTWNSLIPWLFKLAMNSGVTISRLF